jgi:hypothetical protein
LNYSIGIGTGRFYQKSDIDVLYGRGSHGTALFGNISYEVLPFVNVGAEWTGVNLATTVSWRPSYRLPAFCIGVADLTRFSGDKPRLIAGISYAILLPKRST